MSCAPTQCPPPVAPAPKHRPAWTELSPTLRPDWLAPEPNDCGRGTGVYYNVVQTYTNTCSGGSVAPDITVIIRAAAYSSTTSQADANSQAHTAAQTQAAALRVLDPCLSIDAGDYILVDPSGDTFICDNGDSFIL